MNSNKNNNRFVWLVVGTMLFIFVGGRWSNPAAAWLAPIFLLRFSRDTNNAYSAFLWMWLGISIASIIGWRGATALRELGTFAEPCMFTVVAIFTCIPFAVDRIYHQRWAKVRKLTLLQTLIFPICFTAIDYLATVGSPFGSFGAAGYSQAGFTPMMQIVALTGLHGIPFVIGWFASVVNHALENGLSCRETKKEIAVLACVLILVFSYGFGRLYMNQTPREKVLVGGFSLPRERLLSVFGTITQDDETAVRESVTIVHDEQLAQIRKMAKEGAKIITLQEGAGIGYKSEVDKMLNDVCQIAKEEEIYVVLPTAVLSKRGDEPMHNVVHIIDMNGKVVLEHYKYGGAQFEGSVAGDGKLKWTDTPYGRLGAIICWDADFPDIVKQAGQNKIDLLFIPSNDWMQIRDIHANMATFRAVENGVPIVRQTGGGVSLVTDAYGRILNRVDMFEQEQIGDWGGVQMVAVPIGSVDTLFRYFGTSFGLLMTVAMVGVAGMSWFTRANFGQKNPGI